MTLALEKTYPRLWTLHNGQLMVVTDLHGNWTAYQRHRDRFLTLHAQGQADYLIFTGDLIHPHSANEPDHSLNIVLDIIALQKEYGPAIIHLCGNHELPHIYHFSLHKGNREFTASFEAALTASGARPQITALYEQLPFFLRTRAGVSLTHAGATPLVKSLTEAQRIFNWSHADQRQKGQKRLAEMDINSMRAAYARLSHAESYEALAQHYLATSGTDDPRYDDLLVSMFATTGYPYEQLYESLFTKCEYQYGQKEYQLALQALLKNLSVNFVRQHSLIAGHITIKGGHQIVAQNHFRLASSHHATPHTAGQYLLFNAAHPLRTASDLTRHLHTVW